MFGAVEWLEVWGVVVHGTLVGGGGFDVSELCKVGPFVRVCGQLVATFVLKKSLAAVGLSVPFEEDWMLHAVDSVHWSLFLC